MFTLQFIVPTGYYGHIFFQEKKKSPFFSSLLVFHVDMQSPETVNKRAAI
jgi:hypothetical protein